MSAQVAIIATVALHDLEHVAATYAPAGRVVGLRDRCGQRHLVIALFDGEPPRIAVDPVPEPPPRWSGVDRYDVLLDDCGDAQDGATAVATTMDVPVAEVEQVVGYLRDHLWTAVQQRSSCRGILVLADAERTDVLCLTFWSTARVPTAEGAEVFDVVGRWGTAAAGA
jgi:hypothetical protein